MATQDNLNQENSSLVLQTYRTAVNYFRCGTKVTLKTQFCSSFGTFWCFIFLLGAIYLVLGIPNFILSKVEASETYTSDGKKMVIKGLYIGMDDKEAIKIFSSLKDTSNYRSFVKASKGYGYDLRIGDTGKDYVFRDVNSDNGSPYITSRLEFKDNKLDVLILSPGDTYDMFNLSGVEFQDFAGRFGDKYKVRMNKNTDGDYFYRDLENGYAVAIKRDYGYYLLLKSVVNPNKINF